MRTDEQGMRRRVRLTTRLRAELVALTKLAHSKSVRLRLKHICVKATNEVAIILQSRAFGAPTDVKTAGVGPDSRHQHVIGVDEAALLIVDHNEHLALIGPDQSPCRHSVYSDVDWVPSFSRSGKEPVGIGAKVKHFFRKRVWRAQSLKLCLVLQGGWWVWDRRFRPDGNGQRER
jgi:hypothetical protein